MDVKNLNRQLKMGTDIFMNQCKEKRKDAFKYSDIHTASNYAKANNIIFYNASKEILYFRNEYFDDIVARLTDSEEGQYVVSFYQGNELVSERYADTIREIIGCIFDKTNNEKRMIKEFS